MRPTMSDIQKAFMLFGETETQPQREPKQVERQAAARPVAAKQTEIAAERLSARTYETTPAYYAAAPQNKYANINLERFHAGETDISNDMPLKAVKKQRSVITSYSIHYTKLYEYLPGCYSSAPQWQSGSSSASGTWDQ